MEVGMRARQDIEMGEDVTEAISPISHALHPDLLSSHCPTCFNPLPLCNNASHSATHPSLSADLRAALHLLPSHASPSDRTAAGLLTNRRILTALDDEIADEIKDGAQSLAAIGGCSRSAATEALCAVLTNGVEVRKESGLASLGVAVYGPRFSWINHSCSPNACYRISLSLSEPDVTPSWRSRIVPYFSTGADDSDSGLPSLLAEGLGVNGIACGPRIRVRSLRRIRKGEEVTVAYTDLLQPMAMHCTAINVCGPSFRGITCSAAQETCSCSVFDVNEEFLRFFVQEISAADSLSSSSANNFDKDEETQLLAEYMDDAVADYLSAGDARSCCEKLEPILTRGLLGKQLQCEEGRANPTYRLNPLHHLSLDAFTVLASTYKSRANETNGEEFLEMSRIGAAYSLLLVAATNHLFRHETALMPAVANFWASAGESLVSLASNVSSTTRKRYQPCPECPLRDNFGSNRSHSHADFENVSSKFLSCVTARTHNVWRYLTRGSPPLSAFADPFDYSGAWNERGLGHRGVEGSVEREDLIQLGVHCLLYGGYLASICMGENSYLTRHVSSVLHACGVHV